MIKRFAIVGVLFLVFIPHTIAGISFVRQDWTIDINGKAYGIMGIEEVGMSVGQPDHWWTCVYVAGKYHELNVRLPTLLTILAVGMIAILSGLGWKAGFASNRSGRAYQPCASPNGGPATSVDNSNATDGPPSVS